MTNSRSETKAVLGHQTDESMQLFQTLKTSHKQRKSALSSQIGGGGGGEESHFVKILSIVKEQFQVGEENELVERMALE